MTTPLPARVRLRLATHRQVDRAGCWLAGHRCPWAAEMLWRTCRMW
ncbi:hypothetical protein ACH5A2_19710 [Streptomyces collinus]